MHAVSLVSAALHNLRQGVRCRAFLGAILVAAFSLLAGAANAQSTNPTPLINQLVVPAAAAPGGAAFTLTVTGTGFVSSSVVNWNGSARTTAFVSSTKLTASILNTDIATASTASVTVVNPTPGGGTSNVVFFQVASSATTVSLVNNPIPTPTDPVAVAVGDFNHDGKLDVAFADDHNNSVSIMIGNGDGTFKTHVEYAVPGFPIDVVAADLNNDGNLDLVTVDQFLSQVSVLLGNGDGTFQAHKDFAVGKNPQVVVVGDFNGDGKLDLAVANRNDNTVSILLGNGDGTFQSHVDYATGVNPQSVAVGDFNGDGKLDLVVANNNDNTVSILLGNGDGTFQTHVDYGTGSIPNWVTVADFNNDGKLDLAVANSTGTISILLGNGDGTFATHKDYPAGSFPYQVIVGDFNADGKLDMACPNFNDGTISLLLGNGDGTFKPHVDYVSGKNPVALAAGDFNGDGKLDLAIANEFADTMSIQLQTVPAPQPSLKPAFLTFATQEPGTSSAPLTSTLTNTTGATLTINSITLGGAYASSFSQTNTCGTTVAAGGTCTISVTFTPLQSGGQITANVAVSDNAGTQIVTLKGSAKALIQLSPIKMAFATTVVGQSSTSQVATLTNQSGITINFTSISVTGINPTDYTMTNTCGTSLAPFAICNITVTFTPQSGGGKTAAVIVLSSAFDNKRGILLSGTATNVSLSPASLTFAAQTVGTTSTAQTVTFTNAGLGPLSPIFAFTGTNATDFAQTNTCGTSVASGTNCTISVTFTPAATGTRTATMTITDADPTSPQKVTLTGTGQ